MNRSRKIDLIYDTIGDNLFDKNYSAVEEFLEKIISSDDYCLAEILSAIVSCNYMYGSKRISKLKISALKQKAKEVAFKVGGEEKVKEISHHFTED